MRKFVILLISLFILSFDLCGEVEAKMFSSDPVSVDYKMSHAGLCTGFADIIEKAMPAVVTIAATQAVDKRNGLEGFRPPQGTPFDDLFDEFRKLFPNNSPPAVLGGSGFIVSEDGVVVTNCHVIENPEKIVVNFNNEELEAELLGKDKKADIAVLKIKDNSRKYPYLEFSNSDNSRIGDIVIAIGNPLGVGQSVSQGIVSAKSRDIVTDSLVDFIQTDAALNRGNSGGPLLDINGRVIGVNTLILSNSGGANIGIGFAISSNYAKPLVDKLSVGEVIERGWLGVVIQPVTSEIADSLGLAGKVRGALLNAVDEDGPAYKSGLRAGDIILSVDNVEIEDMNALRRTVAYSAIGSEREFLLLRKGKAMKVLVKIGKLGEDDKSKVEGSFDMGPIVIRDLREKEILSFGNSQCKSGVMIEKINNRILREKGLGEGDVIIEVSHRSISNLQEFRSALDSVKEDKGNGLLMRICSYTSKGRYTPPYYVGVPKDIIFGK